MFYFIRNKKKKSVKKKSVKETLKISKYVRFTSMNKQKWIEIWDILHFRFIDFKWENQLYLFRLPLAILFNKITTNAANMQYYDMTINLKTFYLSMWGLNTDRYIESYILFIFLICGNWNWVLLSFLLYFGYQYLFTVSDMKMFKWLDILS